MTKKILAVLALVAIPVFAATAVAKEEKGSKGEELFKLHCAACHPDGGNIINPKETLKKADREAHGIKNAKDIMAKMRKPGPGMTKFDAKTLPDNDAKAIADYILKTFK